MLRLAGVAAAYGSIQALRDVDLELAPGAVGALLGPNGAGKSSVLGVVSGLVPLAAGAVDFEDARIDGLPVDARVRRGIAHVPEGRRLFTELSVTENLHLGAHLRRDRKAVTRDLARMLELFPVLGARSALPAGLLSGGEQQMLAIARGLMSAPRLLLLDEPSMGLAPVVQREIFARIAEIRREGVSVLLAEQNANLALGVADHGHVLAVGRIEGRGTAEELRASDDVRRAYLGV